MRKVLVLVIFLLSSIVFATSIHESFCQDALAGILRELISNPRAFLIFVVQLGLGFGLGYYSMKALKYVVAMFCILTLGVLLSIWQFGFGELFQTLGLDFTQLTTIIKSIILLIGILTLLPIGLGFFMGVIVASRR